MMSILDKHHQWVDSIAREALYMGDQSELEMAHYHLDAVEDDFIDPRLREREYDIEDWLSGWLEPCFSPTEILEYEQHLLEPEWDQEREFEEQEEQQAFLKTSHPDPLINRWRKWQC